MKILHFVPGSGVGGIERFIMDITSIPNQEFEYDFVVFARQKTEFVKCIGERGKVYTFSGWSLEVINRTYRMIKQNKYDVVHAHLGSWSFIILILAKLCGVRKRIAHTHSADSFSNMNVIGKTVYCISKIMNRLCITNYLACSDHACESTFGKRLLKLKKYTRVLNPVDFERIGNTDINAENRLRKELGLRKYCRVICNVGYLGKHKNQAFLLQIAKHQKMSHVDFLLVGDGWNRKNLEEIIKTDNLKNVHILGIRNDIPLILRLADVFVLPSLLEGLGTVVLEAQACGIPCVVSENVTMETDLGLGLVYQIALSDEERWIEAILSIKKPKITSEEILTKFIDKNVEIGACYRLIKSIYEGY